MLGKSPSVTTAPTPYKIKVNNSKLMDSVTKIELTRSILMPHFSNFLRNSIIHFRMFLYLETCFLRLAVSLLCLCYNDAMHVPIYALSNYTNGDEIVLPCDRCSKETATLRKHVTKYKNLRKWMVEFLRKFENRGINIA